jgi:hypothetical protein
MNLTKYAISIALILFLATVWSTRSWGQNADPICAGLTGAAFGQCTAAVAVGCDGSVDQPTGCKKISENYTRLTGESPPWELGSCISP